MVKTTSSSSTLDATHRPGAHDLPRERLLRTGAHRLNNAELLAVCLGTGSRGEDALNLARRLLKDFGGLDAMLHAPPRALLAARGLGSARVALLKALQELTLRHGEEVLTGGAPRRQFTDAVLVSRYLKRRIGHREREIFGCMFLDTRHHLLAFEEIFSGSVDRAHVHPRELLKRGIELNASAVILAHNHPSGVAEPSQADLALTRDLTDLLARVDIRVLDHIIVARSVAVSLASRGLL